MKTKILYEDKDIVVIWKPAGLATQTAKIGQPDVVSELKNYFAAKRPGAGGNVYLGVVHRLDQPVEGVLVFARNKQAAAVLTRQLSGGEGLLHKQYLAVVCGHPSDKSGKLIDYLVKTQDNMAAVSAIGDKAAKKAVLKYELIETCKVEDVEEVSALNTPCAGQDISLLDINIETGRFHQIRAQMSHAGMPLLGDLKYGNAQSKVCSNVLGVRNVALCAYALSLFHPVTGEEMHFEKLPMTIPYDFFSFE